MAKIVKEGKVFGGVPLEVVTAWPPSDNGVEIDMPSLKNITDTVTINSTYVNWAYVYKVGRLVFVSALLKAGVPDQTNIIGNMPECLFETAGTVFYMNAADASREMSAYQMGTALQFRTTATTTGANGALVSVWYIAK